MSKASDLARLVTSGSTAIHGEAGVTSSGSTGKTTNLQQGLSKHFTMYNQEVPSVKESFNQSSITDNAAGDFTTTYTNAFSNTVYCSVGMTENQYTTARGQNGLCIDSQFNSSDSLTNGTALSASARDYRTKYGSNASESAGYSDQAPVMLANFGDLV